MRGRTTATLTGHSHPHPFLLVVLHTAAYTYARLGLGTRLHGTLPPEVISNSRFFVDLRSEALALKPYRPRLF